MSPLTEQILKSKRERRQALARLSFPEKVRIVEQLRDAALQINAASKKAGLIRKRIQTASVGKASVLTPRGLQDPIPLIEVQ